MFYRKNIATLRCTSRTICNVRYDFGESTSISSHQTARTVDSLFHNNSLTCRISISIMLLQQIFYHFYHKRMWVGNVFTHACLSVQAVTLEPLHI